MRPGEPAEILSWRDETYRNYSIESPGGWMVVRDGRYWRETEEPSEDPLFSKDGEWLAPSLREALARTDATVLDGRKSFGEVAEWAERVAELSPRNVCVFPAHLPAVKPFFSSPATVISFPHGASTAEGKVAEIKAAEAVGAGELDIVAPLRLLGRDMHGFRQELQIISAATTLPIKLILETALLGEDDIEEASREAASLGIFCVKTSTGTIEGASGQAVRAMRRGDGEIEIKASGGVRSRLRLGELLRDGATIFGASNAESWT